MGGRVLGLGSVRKAFFRQQILCFYEIFLVSDCHQILAAVVRISVCRLLGTGASRNAHESNGNLAFQENKTSSTVRKLAK